MKRCFFIGHRDAPDTLRPALAEEIERHIVEHGVTEFLVGYHGNFDRIAARELANAKKRHPQVTLTLLLCYHPAEKAVELPDGFDGSLYPFEMEKTVPRRFAIVKANQYAVKTSDYLIAYAWQPGSNAVKLVESAGHKTQVTVLRKMPVW